MRRTSLLWMSVWVVIFTIATVLPVLANTIPGFDPRCIEIDGNVTDDADPCIDWLTKAIDGTLVGLIDGVANNDADILSPDSILSSGSSLPKQDITRVWLSNNNEFLYLAEERRANNGNSSYHLFFTRLEPTVIAGQPVVFHLQNDDIEIRICFPKGSQPDLAEITVWKTAGISGVLDVRAQDIWSAAVFSVPISVAGFEINRVVTAALPGALDRHANPTSEYDVATFAEAAVSLAALGIDPCEDQAYATVITRSSCSLTSDVKDIAGPVLYDFGGPVLGDIIYSVDCENLASFQVTVDEGSPPYRFVWKDNDVVIRDVVVAGTNPITDSFSLTLTNGEHNVKVEVTDAAGCVDTAETGVFPVYEILTARADSPEVQCTGESCAEVRIVGHASGGDGNNSYEWSLGGVPISTNPTLEDCFAPGDYNLIFKVTDGRGCTDSVPVPLTILPAVTLNLEIVSPLDCVSEVELKATAGGGDENYTYTWRVDDIVVLVDGPKSGPSFYTLVFPDEAYCTSATVSVSVVDSRGCANLPPNPSETLEKLTNIVRR